MRLQPEQFIREAAEGAFSQTYSPLEIILSDDCSQDKTSDILKEMAAEYVGPHKIVLNRNECNIGIGEHVNTILGISSGELIVLAAGDDISTPRRVTTLFDYWKENEKPSAIQSDYQKVDDKGGIVEKHHNVGKPGVLRKYLVTSSDVSMPFYRASGILIKGCSSCYAREVFEKFGPLKDVSTEDNILSFRAALMGGIFAFFAKKG